MKRTWTGLLGMAVMIVLSGQVTVVAQDLEDLLDVYDPVAIPETYEAGIYGQEMYLQITVRNTSTATTVTGVYSMISFEDYESKEKSIQTTAGLFVGGETDFDVSFSESDAGGISLSVANVGNNMAYSVKVSIPEQAGYKVTGSSSSIVGNLEKGDYTIAAFNVMNTQGRDDSKSETSRAQADTAKAAPEENLTSASSAPLDSNPLKVQIEYTDAKGERKT